MTLKVGDRVLATEDRYTGDELTIGKEYTVAAILNSDCVHLKGIEGAVHKGRLKKIIEGAVYKGRLKKIEDPTPKFKVGDRAADSFSKEVVTVTALDAHSAWPIRARYKDGGLGLWKESELTKIESVPFKPTHGDKVVNLKTGREGVVLMGQVWDKDIFSKARPVPVSALVEYEEHHAGTYDLIKKDVPW